MIRRQLEILAVVVIFTLFLVMNSREQRWTTAYPKEIVPATSLTLPARSPMPPQPLRPTVTAIHAGEKNRATKGETENQKQAKPVEAVATKTPVAKTKVAAMVKTKPPLKPTATAAPTNTPTAAPTKARIAPAKDTPAILIGAADISVCGQTGDQQTADLIQRLLKQYPKARIFTAGDNAQSNGEMFEYEDCYQNTWGRFKQRIRPSPGNHDWQTDQGRPYFTYFGKAAGEYGLGYYSYNLGGWHIVSLNSNCDSVNCGPESLQGQWLHADLKKNKSACTLLYWHHPLFDSGIEEISHAGLDFWRTASQYHAEVVVNGHDHHYERFAPLDANGDEDREHGIRPFIVGTGGAWLFETGAPLPITEARDNQTLGVIVFSLYPDRYEWQFVPVKGGTFTDAGSGTCH